MTSSGIINNKNVFYLINYKIIYLMLIAVLFITFSNNLFSQSKDIPSVSIKNIKGETIDTKNFENGENPFLVVFFGSCCSPSLRAIENLSENYDLWIEKYNLKIFLISIDDTRSSKKVAPLAKGRGWKFEIYLDENSDFKRAMNVNNKPHYILFNGKKEKIWQKVGFIDGIEQEINNELEKFK
ncbi:MAG TPA: redoxin domain-containing protein [Candidatus Kapabacteria bacterium]|nr:redoxin domain-containing protein [Candidatus Kapabacteria bacterium]